MSFCPQCGTKIEDDAAFCANCGTPVRKRQQPDFQQPIQPQQPESLIPDDMDMDPFDEPTIGVAYPGSFNRLYGDEPVQYDNAEGLSSFEPLQPEPGDDMILTPPTIQQPDFQYQQNGSTTNIYVQQQEPIRPGIFLPTNRGLLKYILLSAITFGIYGIVVMSGVSTDINTVASRYDGRRTMHFCLIFFLFSWLTLGIVPLIWFHNISGRIGNELIRRNINYSFGSSTFWLWGILGSLILVGPFIYYHKLFTAMNLICGDFNQRG